MTAQLHTDAVIEASVVRAVQRRFVPVIFIMVFVSILDRTNIGVAGLTMRADLGLSAAVFGLGATLFTLGYCLLEIPSNLALSKVGARRWLTRIMVSWGLATTATAFVVGERSFLSVRFLLGVAEAGLTPGIMFFLSLWLPARHRAAALGVALIAHPLAGMIGNPISGLLLNLSAFGLAGWQWVFLIEGLLAVVLAIVPFRFLIDRPADAAWLDPAQRDWLARQLEADRARAARQGPVNVVSILGNWRVLFMIGIGIWGSMGISSLTFWLPSIVRDLSAGSDVMSAMIAGIPFGLGALAMYVLSRRAGRGADAMLRIALTHLTIAVALGSLPWLSGWAALAVICVAAAGALASLPLFWSVSTSLFSERTAAVGLALLNMLANIGTGLGPWLFGIIHDRSGNFLPAFIMLACGFVVSASALAFIALRGGLVRDRA